MKLLVSPRNQIEAKECIAASVDIIDVKNPFEGSLGANFPWIIKAIREMTPTATPVSATIGDINYKPGTVALAALGAATAGANYVKVGLHQINTIEEGIEIMTNVKQALESFQLSALIVAAGYAEGESIGSIDPLLIPLIGHEAKSDLVMIDTYNKKNQKSLFDHLSQKELKDFIQEAKEYRLGVALGGSIRTTHFSYLKELKPDIIGIRGAVCEKGDRMEGEIKADLIEQFKNEMKKKELV